MAGDRRARTGRRAEALASDYLEARGLRIVAKNWRRPEGELDLVADDAGVCVFVEIRSRTGEDHGHPLEAVSRRKRSQVIRAARLYLDAEPTTATAFRFDVVGVTFRDGADPEIHHVPSAFDVSSG